MSIRKIRLGHMPAKSNALAGFLWVSYIRNKKLFISISYILLALYLFCLSPAYGIEATSSYFEMEVITFLSSGGAATSTNTGAELMALGEGIAFPEEFSSANFGGLAGQLYLLFIPEEKRAIVISDLRARTEVLGPLIPEATWQRDNDPYFYWHIDIEPAALLTGCSVSLDTLPDNIIDTTSDYYQFPDDSIPSGKHTFYVLPFTTGGVAERDSQLQFEIWVDTDTPVISELKPQAGGFTTDNLIPISCLAYDTDSGLDENSTTLTLNGQSVSFTYDPQTQILKYSPASALPEGENTILLKAYDAAGNYVAKGWNFIVDTQGPSGSILLNNGEEITHSAYVFINIQTDDTISGVKSVYISNDGVFDTEMNHPEPYSPVISNWLVAEPDVDGLKTVYVKFQDAAGNLSEAYKDSITLKLQTPDTRIISAPTLVTPETTANFRYEASRPDCQFSYKLDGTDWTPWSTAAAAEFTGLSAGNHYFYVKSGFDLNGDGEITTDEEDATPAQWVWSIKTAGEREEAPRRILFWRR